MFKKLSVKKTNFILFIIIVLNEKGQRNFLCIIYTVLLI
jgi:hypothetical protein